MNTDHKAAFGKLNALIKDVRICMMTTWDAEIDGLRARPMATQETPSEDGALWFFTDKHTHKVTELAAKPHVGLTYAAPDDATYVSVSGRATVVDDRARMRALWNPMLKAWFPEGVDDPNLVLLRVAPDAAEYWDEPAGQLVQLFGFAKAIVTGTRYQGEGLDNEKLDL